MCNKEWMWYLWFCLRSKTNHYGFSLKVASVFLLPFYRSEMLLWKLQTSVFCILSKIKKTGFEFSIYPPNPQHSLCCLFILCHFNDNYERGTFCQFNQPAYLDWPSVINNQYPPSSFLPEYTTLIIFFTIFLPQKNFFQCNKFNKMNSN